MTFYLPGILALAVMSTAMVSLGISTGFERGYGVLKRLGATPLGRPRLLGAKVTAILLVEVVQAAVLVPVGIGLGWSPPGGQGWAALAVILLATVGFGGLGLFLAGVLRAEVNLAATNGLYLVLLLLGGMIVPLSKLPSGLAAVAQVPPGGRALERAARGAGHRLDRSSARLGGAGPVGGGRPPGRSPHLPLGVKTASPSGPPPAQPQRLGDQLPARAPRTATGRAART